MAEPLGAAVLDGLPDGGQAVALAGVDGDVEVLPVDVLERVQVAARRPARLGPRDVEADDALVAVADRELGDLLGAGRRAHRGEQRADRDPPVLAAVPEAFDDGMDHLVEGQAEVSVQLRGEPDLGVDDAVGGEVLGGLLAPRGTGRPWSA